MKYLVDVNVLCEPTRSAPNVEVSGWLHANVDEIVVDAVVLAEVRLGILVLPHGRRRAKLDEWFHAVVRKIECLPWDVEVSLMWADLLAALRKKGRAIPRLDSMIAATALHHGLTVATRNTRDFELAGVDVVNPFK